MKVVKFLVSGIVGVSVNLSILWVLVHFFGLHYLPASVMAVSFSTVVGFLLQKFWTFGDQGLAHARMQFMLYVLVALANIALNTLIVYVIVDVLHFHYLFAQFFGAGIVAVWSFAIYRYGIFVVRKPIVPVV